MTAPQTVNWAPWVFGDDGVPLDDPAETYHEASRISSVTSDHRVRGAALLERSAELRATVGRASARHPHAATVPLPPSAPLVMPIGEAIAARRSERVHTGDALSLAQLAAILRAGYGVTGSGPEGVPLRSVPSGGALYPLDLYVATSHVEGLGCDIHHYDPLRDALERARSFAPSELERLTPDPSAIRDAAAIVFAAAVFWRARFKYGQRGYRFALLEAGHVAQNILLAATALGLASVPLGGFFDRQVNEFLDLDGLHDAALYVLPIALTAAGASAVEAWAVEASAVEAGE